MRLNLGDLSREHDAWLVEVSSGDAPYISPQVAREAADAWNAAREAGMPVPAGCTGPDGEMFYSWDTDRHHLELEIVPDDGPSLFEWFYRDRESETRLFEECRAGDPIPAAVAGKFHLFMENASCT